MSFSDKLNEYVAQIGCTSKQLAVKCGLSEGTISRYRTGERVPLYESSQMQKLVDGICTLMQEKNIPYKKASVMRELNAMIDNGISVDYKTYILNLNKLLAALNIRSGELARGLHFDPSYISRILSGTRRPADISKFSGNVAAYIVRCFSDSRYLSTLARIFECTQKELSAGAQLYERIIQWLGSNAAVAEEDPVRHFLQKMDDFDLDEYIQAIRFSDMKLPSFISQMPDVKWYSGIEEMMQGELDFIKATVLSESMNDVILYSDMPIEEMASNKDFPKKWMYGMALMLKKGLHLHIIHDVNRPFKEMMIGLESNIPMYMTGQISPYYLRRSQSDTFLHLLKVSGAAAMTGTGIAGHHSEGRYILSKSESEIAYYRKMAKRLMENALPLMNIFTSERKDEFYDELNRLWKSGKKRVAFSSLPLFTMPDELLERIQKRVGMSKKDAEYLKWFKNKYLAHVKQLFQKDLLTVEVPYITRNNTDKTGMYVDLSNTFYPMNIEYTYDEYIEHLEETRKFTGCYSNCTFIENPHPAFKNITFYFVENKYVVVSKCKSPTIHFIIRHPKMVQAFQNFTPIFKD